MTWEACCPVSEMDVSGTGREADDHREPADALPSALQESVRFLLVGKSRLDRTRHRSTGMTVSERTGGRRILIYDTTLRDGEQSPGATMTVDEKLEVSDALVALGVDIIEAGFPAASPGDFEAVRLISQRAKGVVIAGLARAHVGDIERTA